MKQQKTATAIKPKFGKKKVKTLTGSEVVNDRAAVTCTSGNIQPEQVKEAIRQKSKFKMIKVRLAREPERLSTPVMGKGGEKPRKQ